MKKQCQGFINKIVKILTIINVEIEFHGACTHVKHKTYGCILGAERKGSMDVITHKVIPKELAMKNTIGMDRQKSIVKNYWVNQQHYQTYGI